ncbi:hypothetical protein CO267_18540, partial [Acinetobacter baumannii]|uniref:hypothetical protein n=1 Tax=Acinetobacter baumannii TaxID=470 RepID=UPI000BC3DD7C
MPNPAELLHALFSEWRDKRDGSSNEFTVRGLGSNDSDRTENFARHQRAMHHLTQLELVFNALESEGKQVAHIREALPRWRSHILHYPHSWKGAVENNDKNIPSEESLSILATAGLMIDLQYQSMGESTR